MDKMIGVLGGMGSAASETFYKMIVDMTDVTCDQDYPNMVIFSDAGMPDRTGAILRKDYPEIKERMLNDMNKLVACGCEAIGVTCNTAHFFVDMIEKDVDAKIIHMVKETVKQIATENPGAKVAILATVGTIQTKLYQGYMEDAGLVPYIPDEATQKNVMFEIYDKVKKGLPADEKVWQEIEDAIKAAGCQKAILGCTELSVIKEENHLSDYYIDPMRVLAKLLIEFSGKKLKEEYK